MFVENCTHVYIIIRSRCEVEAFKPNVERHVPSLREDSRTTYITSQIKLIFVGHTILVGKTSVWLQIPDIYVLFDIQN